MYRNRKQNGDFQGLGEKEWGVIVQWYRVSVEEDEKVRMCLMPLK